MTEHQNRLAMMQQMGGMGCVFDANGQPLMPMPIQGNAQAGWQTMSDNQQTDENIAAHSYAGPNVEADKIYPHRALKTIFKNEDSKMAVNTLYSFCGKNKISFSFETIKPEDSTEKNWTTWFKVSVDGTDFKCAGLAPGKSSREVAATAGLCYLKQIGKYDETSEQVSKIVNWGGFRENV